MDRARIKEGDDKDGGPDGISRVVSMMWIKMRLTVIVPWEPTRKFKGGVPGC